MPALVHDHADVELEVSSRELAREFTVEEAIDVELAEGFELVLHVEDQVEAQVLERGRLCAGVRVLTILPAERADRFREREAPVRFVFGCAEYAQIFARFRLADGGVLPLWQSLVIDIHELFPGVGQFRN